MFVNHSFRSIFKCGELNITLEGLIEITAISLTEF